MKLRCAFWYLVANCLAAWNGSVQSAPTDQFKPALVTVTDRTFVKGFPIVLRLEARGPQVVGLVSPFHDVANVTVRLTSKDSMAHYDLSSTRGQNITLSDRAGNRFDGTVLNDLALWNDQSRTMLLELASLHREIGRGTTVADVPPGKYLAQVQFPADQVVSPPIEISLQAPNSAEVRYLSEMARQVPKAPRDHEGWPVSWGDVLRGAVDLTALRMDGLSDTAKQQLQFHQLLLHILTSTKRLKEMNLDELRRLPVPAYLEPEKASLLLEVQITQLEGKTESIQAQMDALLKAEPGLTWRIQDAQEGKADWHAYKRNHDADWHPPSQNGRGPG